MRKGMEASVGRAEQTRVSVQEGRVITLWATKRTSAFAPSEIGGF